MLTVTIQNKLIGIINENLWTAWEFYLSARMDYIGKYVIAIHPVNNYLFNTSNAIHPLYTNVELLKLIYTTKITSNRIIN